MTNPMDDKAIRAIVWEALYDLSQVIEGNTEAGTIDHNMTHNLIGDTFDVIEKAVRGTLRERPRERAILDRFQQELDRELSRGEQQGMGLHISFDYPEPAESNSWPPGTLHAKAVFQDGPITWTVHVYPNPGEHWVVTRAMPHGSIASPLPRSSDDPDMTVVRKGSLFDTLRTFANQTRREVEGVS